MPDSSPHPATRDERLEALIADCLERCERGDVAGVGELAAAHPEFSAEVAEFLADWQSFQSAAQVVPAWANGSAHRPSAPLPRRLGDYELLETIAQGGMGIVYRARQLSLRRTVAVKMLRAGAWATPADVQRFLSEAAAAAQLDHPGIVPIYEVGEHEGHPFFSMACVPGESLAQRIADGPLAPRVAAQVVRDVARALHYAHERGIIHRDLKPANILLEGDTPRITDFGLARWAADGSKHTRTGELVGTPSYMAPEQVSPAAGPIGPATDVYALGAVLYCLLTGRPPFQAAHPLDTLRQVREQEPVAPSQLNPLVPADLDTIALHCLEKLPARRYQSSQEVADELARFLEGHSIRTRPVGPLERTARWARRQPLVATLVGLVAASFLAGLAISAYFGILASERATAERQRSEELERALYRSRIMQADLEWQNDNVARADALLDACPARFRNWEWGYLKRKCHAERLTCVGHTGSVRRVRYSSDGARLLSAGQDQTVRLWDAHSGTPLAKWDFPATVMSVAFLPDDHAACALSDGTIVGWNLSTGERRFTERIAPDEIYDLAVSPDGRWLATADDAGRVQVISAFDGSLHATLQHSEEAARAVAFDDLGRLASAGDDELVRLWDWEQKHLLLTFAGHSDSVRALAFVPGKHRLISAGDDQTLHVWDTATGESVDTWEVHDAPVWSIAVSADGSQVASAGEAGSVIVQETATGNLVRTWKGHHLLVYGLAFRPDGREIASSGMDGRINVWDVDSVPYVPRSSGHEARVNEIAVSADGRRIASAAKDGTVRLWDAAQAGEIKTLATGVANLAVAFAPAGDGLVSGGEDGLVRIWRLDGSGESQSLSGHTGPVWSVAVHPDGQQIVSASQDQTVRIWDGASGQELHTLRGHTAAVKCARFSPDGRMLATCGDDESVRLWDPSSGRELGVLAGHTGKVWSVAFSRDGDRLASSGSDGTARIWNPTTGELLLICGPHSGIAYGVAFTPDGSRLVTGSFDQTVKLWDTTSGTEILTLRGHIWSVNSVAVTPDGMTIASGSSDYRVRLWHAVPWW